jgi:uncharacterized protein YkwD
MQNRLLKQAATWITAIFLLTSCDQINRNFSSLPTLIPQDTHQPRIPAQASSTAQMETEVWQQINTIRQQQGLSQLRNNEKLAEVARRYSRQMAEQNFFSHTSPKGDTMVERVHSSGIFYLRLGENLFMGTNIPQPASTAVEGWMNSPGHRRNILLPDYRETGIGVWRKGNTYYFTQLFMRGL